MEKLISYFKLSKAELSKVFFPTKNNVRNAFITVAVVVTVISLFLALVDLIMSFSLKSIL
ncbi:preprotein translocase subunit SecE [Campylobacter sp. MG1]|uniref:preprotein translocase subunit SecE n=1 Tax=Campylobacter sp. MG1 TaxID=2976332 RepID=UPI00226D01DA|nr:preprotein translocase subunit SecE [Campylobacter sp. MG1]